MVEALPPPVRAHFASRASETSRNVHAAQTFFETLSTQAIKGSGVRPEDVVKAHRMADDLDRRASDAALAGLALDTNLETLETQIGRIETAAHNLRRVVAGM